MSTGSAPLISIIIPVYKAESFLEKCVSRLRTQSYTNLEILLVDDGSPDSSGTMCDDFAAEDSRLHVIHKTNGGASDARNVGLDNASGEFVCFVDSDDEITSDYVFGLYDDYSKHPDTDLVIQGFLQKWPDREHIFMMHDSSYEVTTEGMTHFFSEVFVNDFSGPYCKLFRRSIIEEHHIRYSTRIIYGEDFDFLLRYMPFARRITSSSKYNYIYIMRGGTVSTKIYEFDKELSAINQLGGSFHALRSIFDSKGLQRCEGISISAYVRRLISANYQYGYTRSERINHFKQTERSCIDIFAQYTEANSAFMKSVVWLLKKRCYTLLDCVLFLRLNLLS